MRATTSPPRVTPTSISGRPALRRAMAASGTTHVSCFAALNATDVFQVRFRQPASQQDVDATCLRILATVDFLQEAAQARP